MTRIANDEWHSPWQLRHARMAGTEEFSGARLLAGWLDRSALDGQSGTLSQELRGTSTSDFRHAIGNTSPHQQQTLVSLFGEDGLQELSSIAGDPNPELFFTTLLHSGESRQEEGRIAAAHWIYQVVGEFGSSEELRQTARQADEVLQGRGSFGLRFEYFAHNLSQDTMEPSTFVALGLAGVAFRGGRVLGLSGLLGSSSSGFLTRGLGAEALAWFAGFNCEVLTFTASTKLAGGIFGRTQDWSAASWGRDLLGNYLGLGVLRLVGAGSERAFNRLHGIDPLSGQAQRLSAWVGLSQKLFPQAAMLGGLMLSHAFEARVGMRDPMNWDENLATSLGTLIQFSVIQGIMPRLLGARWMEMERGLDLRARLLTAHPPSQNTGGGLGSLLHLGPLTLLHPAMAGAEGLEIPNHLETPLPEPQMPRPMMMAGNQEGGGSSGGDGKGDGKPSDARATPTTPDPSRLRPRLTHPGMGPMRPPAPPMQEEGGPSEDRTSSHPNDGNEASELRRSPTKPLRPITIQTARPKSEAPPPIRTVTLPGIPGSQTMQDLDALLERARAITDPSASGSRATSEGQGKETATSTRDTRPDPRRTRTEPDLSSPDRESPTPPDPSLAGTRAITKPDLRPPRSPAQPPRFSTLDGVGGPKPPGATPAKTEAQPVLQTAVYFPGQPHRLEGLPTGSRLLKLPFTNHPVPAIIEAFDTLLKQRNGSIGVVYEGDSLGHRIDLPDLRIDMHALYREHKLAPDTVLAVGIPAQNAGFTFRVKEGRLTSERYDLSVKNPTPPMRVKDSRVEPVSIPPRSATDAARVNPMRPAIPDHRADSRSCQNFLEVRAALTQFLTPDSGGYITAPAIRLTKGVMGRSELERLAPVLAEHPMAEGQKIQIAWSDAGGGRIILQRTGDRLVAELKSSRKSPETYFFLPQNNAGGGMELLAGESVPLYAFKGWRTFTTEFDRELDRLARIVLGPEGLGDAKGREEGSSLRGAGLARISGQILKSNSGLVSLWPTPARHAFIEAHRLLEKAYTHLDFDAISQFQERMGRERISAYRRVTDDLEKYQREKNLPILVSLQNMPAQLPGSYVVPVAEHLRELFLNQLFPSTGGPRSPFETMAFLKDPVRVGQVFAQTFRSQMEPLWTRIQRINPTLQKHTLATLLEPERPLGPELEALRDQIQSPLIDFGVYGDIVLEGVRDNEKRFFHRNFLRTAFYEKQGIRELYGQLYDATLQIPPATLRALHLTQVSSLEGIHRFVFRQSSRP